MRNSVAKKVSSFARTVQIPVVGDRRAILNRVRARAKRFGFKDSDVRPSQIILYKKLTNNVSSIEWKVNEETGSSVQEIRLDKSDVQYTDRLGLLLHNVTISNGLEIFNQPLLPYPDPQVFAAAGEAAALEGLFQGKLEIKTDTDVRLENYHTAQLRFVPNQQNDGTVIMEYDLEKFLRKIETNIGLWGNKRNTVTLKFPQGSFAAIAGDGSADENYAVFYMDGFKIIRGAESLSKADANVIFEGI